MTGRQMKADELHWTKAPELVATTKHDGQRVTWMGVQALAWDG